MIEVEVRNGVTWLRFAYGKANVMDLEFCTAMAERLEAEATGHGPMVVTGQGRIFSAGVDLKRILDGGDGYIAEFLPALERMFRAAASSLRPLVAAVNGHAIAGGCVLASAADAVIMADGGGRIGVPELAVGVPFPPMAFEIMRDALPPHRVKEVLLGAGTYSATDAVERGLVDEVVDAEGLETAAQARASQLGAIPAEAFAVTKRELNAGMLSRADAGDLEASIALWCSEPVRDAIAGYVKATLGGR